MTSKSTFTLPTDQEIQISRIFDAPCELVFRAHTDASLIAQWWGQGNNSTLVDQLDLRVGGQWRFIQRSDAGEYIFRGEYREITPPHRLVSTFEFEGMPGPTIIETRIFEDMGNGKTRLTTTSLFGSKEERNNTMSYGFRHGAEHSWEILQDFLAKQTEKAPDESDFPFIGRPARDALFEAGYTHLAQLTTVSEAKLLALHGVGPKAIRILRETLASKGQAFAPPQPKTP